MDINCDNPVEYVFTKDGQPIFRVVIGLDESIEPTYPCISVFSPNKPLPLFQIFDEGVVINAPIRNRTEENMTLVSDKKNIYFEADLGKVISAAPIQPLAGIET